MRHGPRHPFIAALLAKLDDARCCDWAAREWHSATFSGERINLTITCEGADAQKRLARFARTLPDLEFALTGHFVADISAHRVDQLGDGPCLAIEALLIRDVG